MKKILWMCVGLLMMAAPLSAQSVKLPPEIKGARGELIIVTPTVDGGTPQWRVDPGLKEVDLTPLLPAGQQGKLKGKAFTSAVNGKFKVEVWCAKGDLVSDIATTLIVVGDGKSAGPAKRGSADDKPKDDAKTPDQQKPPPIPGPGFRVVIVHDAGKLDPKVSQVLRSDLILDFLEDNCTPTPGKANSDNGFIIVDKDFDLTIYTKLWQNALKRPRASLPWIIISNGTTGVEQPLPDTKEKTLELLKQVLKGSPPNPVLPPPDPGLSTQIRERISTWEQFYPQYSSKP